MRGRASVRITFLALAAVTIAVGLWVHKSRLPFNGELRDVCGDLLWASMIGCLLGAAAPTATLPGRGLVALAICFAVELSQLIHAPALDAARQTTLGHLTLGSGFAGRDLLSYAAGVALVSLLEWIFRGRKGRFERPAN